MKTKNNLIAVDYRLNILNNASDKINDLMGDSIEQAVTNFEGKHKIFFEKHLGIPKQNIQKKGYDCTNTLTGTVFLDKQQLYWVFTKFCGEWVDSDPDEDMFCIREWYGDPSNMLEELKTQTDGHVDLYVDFFNITEKMIDEIEKEIIAEGT